MAIPGRVDLNDLVIFEAVAESGGFTAAAELLGVAPAKISVEINRLEEKLGITLLSRTTRKVILTDEGQTFYEECRPLLQGLHDAIERLGSGKNELTGTLRISSTVEHAALILAPALAEFARHHPSLRIDLRTSDHIVDLIEERIDVAIRFGWLPDSSLRAVKLGDFTQCVVASPEYLQGIKPPEKPEDLANLDWIALTLLPTPLTWDFSNNVGEKRIVHVKSRIKVDSTGALCAMIQQGSGVSILDHFNAREGMQANKMVQLLPEWTLPSAGIYAVYPPGRQVSAKIRIFIDFYKKYLIKLGI
jgi:DNA-binding transcriptional LysR family regulator